jgi:hypothetical protein
MLDSLLFVFNQFLGQFERLVVLAVQDLFADLVNEAEGARRRLHDFPDELPVDRVVLD